MTSSSASSSSGPAAACTRRPSASATATVASSSTASSAPSARAAAGKAAAPAAPDCEFGTGYPGGPGTKDWLERNLQPVFGWPSIVRFSWSTAREMLGDVEGGGNAALAGAARFTWAADADAESGALGGVPKLSDYFFSKPADGGESKRATDEAAPAAKRLRHQYFRDRKLEIVTSVF